MTDKTNTITLSFVDTETTGLDQDKGHRFIEIAFILFSYNTITEEVKPLGKYIQGINPDRSIDPKAQAVHGKSIDDLSDFPLWKEVAPKVVKVLGMTDLLIAHNVAFDAPFIANELLRVGQPIPDCETYCTMQKGRFASFDGKVPKLEKLAECLGVEYDRAKAHGAEYDTRVLAKCFFAGLKRGVFAIPESLLPQKLENAA